MINIKQFTLFVNGSANAGADYSYLVDYNNPNSLGSILRRRRHLTTLIHSIHARRGQVRILDLGGRRQYWKIFEDSWLAARRVHVTIVNVETAAANKDDDGKNVRSRCRPGKIVARKTQTSFPWTSENDETSIHACRSMSYKTRLRPA
jgi:hypothetical protein